MMRETERVGQHPAEHRRLKDGVRVHAAVEQHVEVELEVPAYEKLDLRQLFVEQRDGRLVPPEVIVSLADAERHKKRQTGHLLDAVGLGVDEDDFAREIWEVLWSRQDGLRVLHDGMRG